MDKGIEVRARPGWHRRLLALAAVLAAGTAHSATLEVAVFNVRNDRGHIHVEVCTRDQFLNDCPLFVRAPAHTGTTVLRIAGLAPGTYAAQAYHDENDNNRVDRGLLGLPREGVGFSNDARIRLGPPRWNNAKFEFAGKPGERIGFSLRYFGR